MNGCRDERKGTGNFGQHLELPGLVLIVDRGGGLCGKSVSDTQGRWKFVEKHETEMVINSEVMNSGLANYTADYKVVMSWTAYRTTIPFSSNSSSQALSLKFTQGVSTWRSVSSWRSQCSWISNRLPTRGLNIVFNWCKASSSS